MKKILTILLLSVHLAGNTEIGQLLKFPELLSHFFQHHRQDPNISFMEFLTMHYNGDDGTSADDDIDSKLPYQNTKHNTVTVTYTPLVKEIPSFVFTGLESKNFNSRLQLGISSKHVLLVLQPPKQA